MSGTAPIKPADLLIDEENPRLSQPNVGQREAQRAIAHNQPKKLLMLAQDIVLHGLNPADLPIVMPYADDPNRHIVLEGNRRLTALRALENPDSINGAVSARVLSRIRRLGQQYQNTPIESVQCTVVKNRDEARHWIELRHTGENEGAGIVRWDTHEKERFNARAGRLGIHTQALDFLESRGYLSAEARHNIPASSFERLIGTPEVRSKLGIEVKGGQLCLLADEQRVAKALLYVANDLASGKTRTGDIYKKLHRVEYANKLPARVVVKSVVKSGDGAPMSDGTTLNRPKHATGVKIARLRDKLIPRDCELNVNDPRLRRIETELRLLSLEQHTNAVGVLFRVFIELSVDHYINRMALPIKERANLALKLNTVAANLIDRSRLTQQQAKPVRRACQKDSFLAPSVDLLHQYVHNRHAFPAPGDLRAHWDNLQPFMLATWSS